MKSLKVAILLSVLNATNAFAGSAAADTFDRLKELAGTWHGTMSTSPRVAGVEGTKTTVTLRVTSMGNVLMHEMVGEGRPDDPITMLYLQGESLELTHYCDAGNRPRMTGQLAGDGKSVAYESVHVDGPMHHGHMHGATFTFVDDDHHVEEWTFMAPNGQPVKARVELRRAQ